MGSPSCEERPGEEAGAGIPPALPSLTPQLVQQSRHDCSLASPALIPALDVLGLGPGWYGIQPMDPLAGDLLFQREMTGLSQREQVVCWNLTTFGPQSYKGRIKS